MKKEYKIFALFFLGLIFVSLFINAVSAGPLIDGIKQVFSGASMDKDILSRYLLIALVVMMVYSVASFIPFLSTSDPVLKWVFSIIVGVLSFLYVSPDDIRYILTNYEALGVALTTIIPLVIVMTFTFELRKQNPGMASIVNKIIYCVFGLYLLAKWLTLLNTPLKNSILADVYIITLLLVAAMLILERWIYFKIFGALGKGKVDAYKTFDKIKIQAEINDLEDKKSKLTAPADIKVIEDRIKVLRKLLSK